MAFWKKIGRALFYSEIRALEQSRESNARLREAFSIAFGAKARARSLERERQREAASGIPAERFRRMAEESGLTTGDLERRRQDVKISKYFYWFGVLMVAFILWVVLTRLPWGWAIFLLPFAGLALAVFLSGVAYFALMEEQLREQKLLSMRQFFSSPGFWHRLFL